MTKERRSPFQTFIDQVNTHIKSREAQTKVGEELTSHLEESSEAFQCAGYTQEEADKKAVKQMGNPIILGKELHQLHRPKMDWGLMTLFMLIIGVSLIPMYTLEETFEGLFFKKMVFSLIAVAIVIGLLLVDYRKLKHFGTGFYMAAVLMMLVVVVFGANILGKPVLDSTFFRIDFLWTLLLFYLAWTSMLDNVKTYHTVGKKALLYILFWLPIIIYVWNGYYMLTVMYFFSTLAMVYHSKFKKQYVIQFTMINSIVALLFSVLFLLTAPAHIQEKIAAYLDLESHQQTSGYQVSVARDMLTEAGWFGHDVTSGASMLPEAHTNMIFPYLVYTFGWLFGLFVFSMLLLLSMRMIFTVKKTADAYGQLLVIGGVVLFVASFIWNIFMSVGLLPMTGVSLPFLSFGGAQLIFYSIIIGLILSVYRRKDLALLDANDT